MLLFLPRQENHHLPPFLGIFSFMMFSTAAWSHKKNHTTTTQHHKKNTPKKLKAEARMGGDWDSGKREEAVKGCGLRRTEL